jgi:hypothetical protein
MMEIGGVITFVLVAIVIVAAPFVIPWADRRRVRRKIESIGGRVVSIERGPLLVLRWVINVGHATFWTVRYVAKTGERRVAFCIVGSFRCHIKKDEPDTAEGDRPEPSP